MRFALPALSATALAATLTGCVGCTGTAGVCGATWRGVCGAHLCVARCGVRLGLSPALRLGMAPPAVRMAPRLAVTGNNT